MASNRHKEGKQKRDAGAFVIIPHAVLHSEAYLSLPAFAKTLLIDLALQYRGDNNGDLCAAWKLMKKRGWKSEATLHRAKLQLIAGGFIFETRKGARPNKASLYAVTWLALDECGGKLDVSVKAFPRGAYRQHDPYPPLRAVAGGLGN